MQLAAEIILVLIRKLVMFKQHVRSIFSLINMFLLLFQSFMPGIFAFLPTQAHAQEEIATQSAQVEVVAEPETEVLEVTETTKEVVIEEIVEPTAGPVPMTVVDETQEENVWKIDGSTATLALVELGVTYSAPQNDKVQITFTRLPEVAGSLTITELELSTEQVAALGAYSNIAYDITSSMEDGSFEYELKLPLPEGAPDSAQIKYAESVAELSSASAVENEVVTDDAVIASGLEHFTVFVVVYDSNLAPDPDLSGVTFIGSPKYVRENNGTDLAAQIQVPSATTEVNFIVDGNTGSPINVTTVTAGAPAGSEWYRLKTPLSAGEHTITAQVKIGGIWYDVAPTATVYSLDIPWFQYQHPQSGIFYRPTDGFARIRIDDEFNQVRSVTFALYTVTNSLVGNFTVNRAECDLRSEGNYLICDLMRDYSGSLPVLSGGDYYLKLQTQDFAGGGVRYGHGNSRSVTFTIDAQAPVVHSIQSAVPQSIFANTFTAVVDATDDIGLASVDVYYTEKRFDGQCDPNMSKIDQQTVLSPELDGKYHATFNTAALNGEYCFFAVAEDLANSHSNPQQGKAKFVFDNISPVTTLTSPVSGATNRAITIAGSSSDVNTVESVKLSYSVAGQNDWQEITTILNGSDTQPFVFSYAWTPSAQGTYDIMAAGTDSVGNVEHSAYVYGVTYDTTVPATPGLNTPVDGYRTKGVSFTQKWFSVADAVSYEYQSCNNDPGDTSGACSSVKFTQTFNGVNNTTKSVGAGQPNSHFWWRVRAKDSASNWSNWSESRELIIDNSAPTTVWDSLASAYFSTTPVLTGVATDVYLAGIANVSYRVENTNDATTVFDWQNATASDGTFSDITENFVTNLGSLVDGAYTFLVRAIDRAGNQGTATEVELIVDTTDPISTITTYNLEDGEEVQTSTFDGLIEGSATDLPTDIASGVDYVLLSISHLGFGEDEENTQYWDDEAGTWVDESSLFRAIWDDEAQTWEYQLPDTPEGFYTVTSHAVDKAGNVEDTYTIKIVYDKTIPEVTLTINPTLPDANNGWYKTQPTITLTANDNYSVDHIEYQWNSTAGSWTVYSAPLTPPGEGQNILYYRAVDTVGNVSGLGIKEVKYDKTAPVNGPLNVRVENIGSTTATGKWSKPNGDEQVHEYKLSWKHKVTGTEYSDTVSSETFEHKLTNLFDGLWEFRVLALDAAGHSKDASTEFRVGPEPASGTVLGVDTENGLSNQTGTNTVVTLSEETTGSESSDETSEKATTSEKEESGSVLGESDVACATWKYYLPLILLFTQILLAISLEFAIKQPGIGKLLFAFAISGLLIGSFYLLRDSGCYGDSTGLLQSVAKWFALISLLLAFVLRRLGSITVEEK